MQLFWFIPTHGDSRYLGTSEGAREVSFSSGEHAERDEAMPPVSQEDVVIIEDL